MVKGLLFDLDGVITDTAKLHYLAWKEMANMIDIEIDEQFNETLKGIDRRGSIDKILALGNKQISEEEIERLMHYKNNYYITLLEEITAKDILPGIVNLLEEARKNNVKVAIASASKNAPLIIEKLGIINLIDYIASPEEAIYSKPHPAIFELAAKGIDLLPGDCIGIEDSEAGLKSIKDAGAFAIGIGVTGADYGVNSTIELTFDKIKELV